MDFESASKACCSKSLQPLKDHQREHSRKLIVVEDEDSNDSAYETGSSLSRSCQSSPTSDIQELKPVPPNSKDRRIGYCYYANVKGDHNFPGPWQLIKYIKESTTPNAIKNRGDVVVISDSDDDDHANDDAEEIESKPLTKFDSIAATKSELPDVVIIDSDEDDDDDDHKSEAGEPMRYHIIKCNDGQMKRIPNHCISNMCAPEPKIKIRSKTRVIARRKSDGLPLIYSRFKNKYVQIYSNDEEAFYPGILSEYKFVENEIWNYLIFFDDGHVQYVSNNDIRVVFGNYGTKYVHSKAKRFYDYYFNAIRWTKLGEVRPTKLDCQLRVFLNGEFESATVVDYNENKPGLVLLQYEKSRYAEWLYVGSPRLESVWMSINKNKKLKRYHDANATLIEVSSDSDEEEDYKSPQKQPLSAGARNPLQKRVELHPSSLIDNYKPTKRLDRGHICGRNCVRDFEQNEQIFKYDPLKRPVLAGWTRNTTGLCQYVTPCGRSFTTIEATHKYLINTKSKLTVDCFTFSPNIDCMTEVHSYAIGGRKDYLQDLVRGGWRENLRIPVVSIGTNVPYFKEYVTRYRRNPRSKKVPAILDEVVNPFRSGCDCEDDCSVTSKCSCWQLTQGTEQKRSIGYKYRRLNDKVDTGIYECNPSCKCSSRCLNRVVSAQIEQKLELYETKDRGYGIRCQTDLPKGTFISCYFGDLLHGKTADERAMIKIGSIHGDEYFMQLDHIEMAMQYKDGYESDVDFDPDDLVQTSMKRPKLDDSLKQRTPRVNISIKTVNDCLDYFPSITKKKQIVEVTHRTKLFGENAVEFVVDGRFRGNISRFFNHSCSPNLFSQTVFVDTHDLRFPWLSFFAAYDIKAGTELTWDYNYAIGSIEGRQIECKCGAPECRKRLL